jgi:hypothetical protein
VEPLSDRQSPEAPFQPGTPLGDRLRIVAALGHCPYGEVYVAEDTSGVEVTVRRIRPELVATPEARGRLHAEIARAATLDHPGIIKPLDFLEVGGEVAVVSQLFRGQSLRAALTGRRTPASLADACSCVLNLCAALVHAAPITFHGGITASNVLLQSGGRVKLGEWGLARALPLRPELVEPPDRPALAPELPAADGRSDLYALGAILFELLTGRPPVAGMLPRSLNARLPPDIDAIAACLLAAAPGERFADATTLQKALERLLGAEEAAARAARAMEAARVSREQAALHVAKKPKKIKVDENEPRWLIHKGKLDYGPYSLGEIKQKIIAHEIVPGDIVIDQELGKRAEVDAHPLLHKLVLDAAHERQALNEAEVVRTHKKRGLAVYGVIGLGAAVLLGGGFFVFRALGADTTASAHHAEAAALEGAELAGIHFAGAHHVDDRDIQRRHKAQGGARPSAPSPGSGAGKDAFDDSTSFDMAGDVGDERLDDSAIDAVLNKHAGSLAHCLRADADRGGARKADIEFIVLGSGKVSGARVNGETGTGLASCVRAALQAMQFPSFNGPRTKATFAMSL